MAILIPEIKYKCGKCGAKLSPGYDFCLSCGTKFSEVPPLTKTRRSSRSKILTISQLEEKDEKKKKRKEKAAAKEHSAVYLYGLISVKWYYWIGLIMCCLIIILIIIFCL